MSTALNDRDAILQAASVRVINPKNASILMAASTSLFHLNATGDVDVPAITITATLIGLEGDVTFTVDGAALTSVTGKTAVVRYVDMQGPTAIVTARILAGGQTFSQSCIIGTVRDGASGGSGARGAGMYFAPGNAWSDGVADATTPGGNVVGDVVTIQNGGTYAMTKRWDGASWLVMGAVFDGSLFVTGSINGAAMRAGTLDILAADGSIILKASGTLAQQVASNPNLVASPVAWPYQYNGAFGGRNDNTQFKDGHYLLLPVASDDRYVGLESHELGLPQGATFTVSFDAYCEGASRTLNVDVVNNTGWDGVGFSAAIDNQIRSYSFTEVAIQRGDAPQGRLRIFSVEPGKSYIVVCNIKVELGNKVTSWCDTVIAAGNVKQKVMPGAIGNTEFGGDLFSSNWNGNVGPGGAGWLMQRSGNLHAASVQLRGDIMGGSYSGPNWPAAGGGGYFLGHAGLLIGNANDGRYVLIGAEGNMFMPGFAHVNGQLTLDNTIIINPRLQTQFTAVLAHVNRTGLANTSTYVDYVTFIPTLTNGVAPYSFAWTFSREEGDMLMSGDPGSDRVVIRGRGTNNLNLGWATVTVTDANGSIARTTGRVIARHGTLS